MSDNLQRLNFVLIPGPETYSEPLYSTNITEIHEYSCKDVAGAILSIDGAEQTSPKNTGWWKWQARIIRGDRVITVDMSCLDSEETIWGGSVFAGDCELIDTNDIWDHLDKKGFEFIFYHDAECRMFSRATFIQELPDTSLTLKR